MPRIHILGASGAGTSTLGAALAETLGMPHLDSDHFYWLPTEPPFTTPRPRPERVEMLMAAAPVLRVDAARPVNALVDEVLRALPQ